MRVDTQDALPVQEQEFFSPNKHPFLPGHFAMLIAVLCAIYAISWKQVFSFDLWILKDRGSFLNLDYLLDQHLRLGVDTFYSYGLLPVAIQHGLFVIFGRGYGPLLACAVVTLVLIALFCAQLLRFLPKGWIWIASLVAFSRILNPVNPNLPYALVELSILFALLLVLCGRTNLALAVSAIGCWSVPSLPIVLCGLLAVLLLLEWWLKPTRSVASLAAAFAPGIAAYLGLGLLLMLEFGWASVMATATPASGMSFYKQVHYGSGTALREFLLPAGHHARFYLVHSILTPVLWWLLSTLGLVAFAIIALRRMWHARALAPVDATICLCAVIQIIFICIAYGAPHQHYIYDPVVIVGVLLGLAAIPEGSVRRWLLMIFVVLGIAGQAVLARDLAHSWKQVRSADLTINLYAEKAWIAEWARILDLSKRQNVLLFSYSTGAHHYFPTIHSPESWMLRAGLLLPADKARVLAQLDVSDVVVLDLTSPTDLVEMDADVQAHLYGLCLTESTAYVQVWWRRSLRDGADCIENPRRFYGR